MTDSTSEISPAPRIRETHIQVIEVAVPQSTKWDSAAVNELMIGIFDLVPLTLSIEATSENISWLIEVPRDATAALINTLHSTYPQADIKVQDKTKANLDYYLYQIHGAAPFIGPLRSADDFGNRDSLVSLVTAMSNLEDGETIIYSLQLSHATPEQYELGEKLSRRSLTKWYDFFVPFLTVAFLARKAGGYDDINRFAPQLQALVNAKLGSSLMQTAMSFKIKAGTKDRVKDLMRLFSPVIAQYELAGSNFLVPPIKDSFSLILTAGEIGALWHPPTEQCQVAKIHWAKSAKAPLPAQVTKNKKGTLLGIHSYQGKETKIWLSDDDRKTHINIIGGTGVGKSTLMHHMVHQDIAAGKGVGVIDPHGLLIHNILTTLPEEREKDVVLFDLTDTEYPIGLNLLMAPPNVPPGDVAGQTVSIVQKMYDDAWSKTRMERALYAALISLLNHEWATIQDVETLFYDSDFRAEVVKDTTDPVALKFWYNQFEPSPVGIKMQTVAPLSNRLDNFYRNETIRRIVCQQSSLDFSALMNNKKIFLASLAGVPKIESETLGALLISKFQVAAMSRSLMGEKEVEPFYMYVDEVQNMSTTSLPTLFSEARKYGIRLCVANQYLQQLEGGTLDAILGNTVTNITFWIGLKKDASAIAPSVEPQFSASDLMNLSRYHAVIKTKISNETVPAFNIKTRPPLEVLPGVEDRIQRIREQSRKQYAKHRDEVDAEIEKHIRRPSGKNKTDSDKDKGEEEFLG